MYIFIITNIISKFLEKIIKCKSLSTGVFAEEELYLKVFERTDLRRMLVVFERTDLRRMLVDFEELFLNLF
jgi:hypothetical protein